MPSPDSPLCAVEAGIATAAARAGREARAITLIAVSKTHSADTIRPLIVAGQRVFGENRVQEAAEKWPALRDEAAGIALHLVGQLQSNKAEQAVALFDAIHSIDRLSLVAALARAMDKADKRPDCFVQVNIGAEAQKGGVEIAALPALLAEARAAALPVIGLMAVPPLGVEPAPYFALLAKLARDAGLAALSMGMSGDYETAVMLGATHVRVGSALFGGARVKAIIFDFDGVLIESEWEGNRHLAELLTELGHPTTVEESLRQFMGLGGSDFHAAVERWIGAPIPPAFHALREAEDARALAEGVEAIPGAVAFVGSLPAELPLAIASSSTVQWIAAHLRHIGLAARFEDRLFSGREHVARGKPAPDIYLHAAAELGVNIAHCLVIEDSPVGVTGAVASGAYVIGLAAGRHCGPGHGERLRGLGAHDVAEDYAALAGLITIGARSGRA